MHFRGGNPVLREVTFEVRPGEQVGICGRTGAGKSSLLTALFRMNGKGISGGRILIDGIDIATIELQRLRSALAVIPQDPVLFTGTVRTNLDPAGNATDATLWAILDRIGLASQLRERTGAGLGLSEPVTEHGENWSVGQRQLVCIARALLRSSRILVLDEATATVDMLSDKLIQLALRDGLRESSRTVLTIAHRLQTIADSDRIIVMRDGRLEEFDTPAALLEKEDGIFASMMARATKK
jgi:ABC-type multidrug transport system fused ATPase/permease subunit